MLLASGGTDNAIKIWNVKSGTEIKHLTGHSDWADSVVFSPDGKTLISGSHDTTVKLWNTYSWEEIKTLGSGVRTVGRSQSAISPDGKVIALGYENGKINLWNTDLDKGIKTLEGHSKNSEAESGRINIFGFTQNNKILISGGEDGVIKFWNVETGMLLKSFGKHEGAVSKITFSPDESILISTDDLEVKLWNVFTNKEISTFKLEMGDDVDYLALSSDNTRLFTEVTGGDNTGIRIFNVLSGKEVLSWVYSYYDAIDEVEGKKIKKKYDEISKEFPTLYKNNESRFLISEGENNRVNLYFNKKLILTLVSRDENNWIVLEPNGRFDTNQLIDQIKGLHWIVNDEPLIPLSIDVFMRQYFEPDLLRRIFKCSVVENCSEEFKTLPSISEINRVQPKVVIKEIKPVKNSIDLADVTVEVESVTEDVSISATDRTKKKKGNFWSV